jgi:hypothetical protein
MKRLIQTLRPIALIGIGLLLAVTSAAISQPILTGDGASAATVVPTSTPQAVSEVGSTDWITLVFHITSSSSLAPIIAAANPGTTKTFIAYAARAESQCSSAPGRNGVERSALLPSLHA